MRFHARVITDFFQDNKRENDDLIYTDIINTKDKLFINISSNMRKFINKSTSHISKKRDNISFDNVEYYELIKQLVLNIKNFMDRCETSLKIEHQSSYLTKDVETKKKYIEKRLYQVVECLSSA